MYFYLAIGSVNKKAYSKRIRNYIRSRNKHPTFSCLVQGQRTKNRSLAMTTSSGADAVSYTHLDVYKRQVYIWRQDNFIHNTLKITVVLWLYNKKLFNKDMSFNKRVYWIVLHISYLYVEFHLFAQTPCTPLAARLHRCYLHFDRPKTTPLKIYVLANTYCDMKLSLFIT